VSHRRSIIKNDDVAMATSKQLTASSNPNLQSKVTSFEFVPLAGLAISANLVAMVEKRLGII